MRLVLMQDVEFITQLFNVKEIKQTNILNETITSVYDVLEVITLCQLY